jgi:hypothetical protein
MDAGIDYGLGQSNIDRANGIRYGVISQHDVIEAWGDAEAIYPCTECDCSEDERDSCEMEPIGWDYRQGGYIAMDCLDSDVIIIKSPFYTFGPFCSPCVPGAVSLNSARDRDRDSGVAAYCFGHDWFDGGVAPYAVYGVITHRECFPDAWYGC